MRCRSMMSSPSTACASRRGVVVPSVSIRGIPTRLHLSKTNRRAAFVVVKDSADSTQQTVAEPSTSSEEAVASSNGNGIPAAAAPAPLPEAPLEYKEPSGSEKFWTGFKLAFALPWRRFKKGSVLVMKLEGDVSDQSLGRFDPGLSVPQICYSLQKAALDPRIKGVALEIGPMATGWAKLQEIRRYLSYFKQSGKFTMAYMKQAGEKEYYLASACAEIFAPPTASISLRGFAVTGTFLRGVLDKVGVEPQVKRIGKYKSAGDQLLRRDMSEPQAEQLGAILDDIYEEFVSTVAEARGKAREDVVAMLEEGIFDMQRFLEGGWVTALKYEDEVIDDLKERTETEKDKPLKKVELRKYSKVSPSAFGLRGKKRIVVLRTSGAILGKDSGSGGSITPDGVIPILRSLAKDKGCAAVVLRVDSPGGDALASDLMWREIKKLGEKKPVVASMGDVAASGGYYMSMGCKTIVAEPLTLTGSIGVVTGKFNLAELYEKIGYSKTVLSKGRYAELLADNRSFTPEEQELFDRAADHAYQSFRNKAAESRGMPVESMQEVAQGRVWTGKAALERGLVDALGGVHRAVAIAKQMAEIPDDERVTVMELGRKRTSPLALLGGGASVSSVMAGVLAGVAAGSGVPGTSSSAGSAVAAGLEPALSSMAAALTLAVTQLQAGRVSFLMTDLDAAQIGSASSFGSSGASSVGLSGSGSFLSEGDHSYGIEVLGEWLQ